MRYVFILLCIAGCALVLPARAQIQRQPAREGAELDSLRKLEESSRDTVIFNSKYIRYTNRVIFRENTQTVPIDTTLRRTQNYNILNTPERPTIGLGNLGLAYRELLFNPSKDIGFDLGFHSYDIYKLSQDSLRYYRARTPFTSLYYVNGSRAEQVLKVTHSQNIKRNWNIGAVYNRIGARGTYRNQNADHLNAALFTWYESPNKRYNLFMNGLFNTIKAEENGSVVNDSIFTGTGRLGAAEETVKLSNRSDPSRQVIKDKSFYLGQYYYIGRLDSIARDSASRVLPTQRLFHAISYNDNLSYFYKNEADTYNALPDIAGDPTRVGDSTQLKNIRNEFYYSFYLRGRAVKFIKNEVKLNVGLQHDIYKYWQEGREMNFSNTSLKGDLRYRFSDRVSITGGVNQVIQGRNAGDFLYEANAQFQLSKSAGRIILGAYTQNRSPELIYESLNYTYHKWSESWDNTKVNNLSFAYQNPKFRFNIKAEYFLMNNYNYLEETSFPNQIRPVQQTGDISLLKLTASKEFKFGDFNLESFVVYQKTNEMELLRTPEFYTYNSFYWGKRLFKSALTANLGFDARMNTTFTAPSYAINISKFFNGPAVRYSSYPIIDLWARFSLRRANIFVRYDYANKGLFSPGYYTVNRYPMPGSLFKYGVIWNFYD